MIFKILGVVVTIYTIHAGFTGRVYAKSGIRGRTIERAKSPGYFWTVIVIYAGLSLALFFFF